MRDYEVVKESVPPGYEAAAAGATAPGIWVAYPVSQLPDLGNAPFAMPGPDDPVIDILDLDKVFLHQMIRLAFVCLLSS